MIEIYKMILINGANWISWVATLNANGKINGKYGSV